MTANVPISSSVIPNSTACRHLAMMSLLVRSNTNEESTNESPVPWLPVLNHLAMPGCSKINTHWDRCGVYYVNPIDGRER
jgi:hypothetical protein